MPPGQPANPSKIPSDYYCRTQAVYQMDLALLRVRFDNAFFCSGKRGSRVIWVLKMARLETWISTEEKDEKLTNSLISRPSSSVKQMATAFLWEWDLFGQRTDNSVFPPALPQGPGLLWWLISSTADPFLNNRIPAGYAGVVVFTDRSSSALCAYCTAALMQSQNNQPPCLT